MSRFTWVPARLRRRPGSAVLAVVLLVTAMGASLGAGYVVAHPLLRGGGANVAKGDTVAHLNGESGTFEAEAYALASGGGPIEVVTLRDGRVAVVDNRKHTIKIIDSPNAGGKQQSQVTSTGEVSVVPAPDAGYVVDVDHGRVQPIGPAGGKAPVPVSVPGATRDAVPDADAGIWVRTGAGQAAHVSNGQTSTVTAPSPITKLTTAGGRPIGLTADNLLYDLAATPPRQLTATPVPLGPPDGLLLATPAGAGRWVTIVDNHNHALLVADPDTGEVRRFSDLPLAASHVFGPPAQAGDAVYVPDFATHALLRYDPRGGRVRPDIPVPGAERTFSVEVRDGRVWANDQYDQRTLLIEPGGRITLVDKGTGHGVRTDTGSPPNEPAKTPTQQPNRPDPRGTTPQPNRPREPGGGPGRQPAGRQTPPPPPPAPVEPPVAVPDIAPGTDLDAACQRIEAAGLVCTRVSAGEGGPTNTVIDTNLPAGTLVQKGRPVRVRYYGQVQVPNVVGLPVQAACDQITQVVAANFGCNRQPAAGTSLDTLGQVSAQNPGPNTPADTGTQVAVSFWNTAPMPSYLGQADANAVCAEIAQRTQQQVPCTAAPGPTTAASGQPPGVVISQDPPAGAPVTLGQGSVTITYVIDSARVPPLVGASPEAANAALQAAGFTPVPVADALARNRVVTSQDVAPGTPQDGGNVVYHYSPVEPVAINLYTNGDDVWVPRLASEPPAGYTLAGLLGYAYPAGAAGTEHILGYQCTDSVSTCDGHNPNHFYSRDATPNLRPGWRFTREIFTLLAGVAPWQCAVGQVPLGRTWYFSGSTRTYRLEGTPNSGVTGSEFLGCLWAP